MGLEFQPPAFVQPKEYSGLTSSIDNLFNAYNKGKMQAAQLEGLQAQLDAARQGQQIAQAQFAMSFGGMTPDKVISKLPQAMRPPSVIPQSLTPNGPQQSFMQTLENGQQQPAPQFAQDDPDVSVLRGIIQMHLKGAQTAGQQQMAGLEKTRAETTLDIASANEKQAMADYFHSVHGAGPQVKNIGGVDYLVTPSKMGPYYSPIPERIPAQSEQAARGFADKAMQAHDTLNKITGKGVDPSSAMVSAQAMLPDIMQSPDVKNLEQTKRQFVNAILRRESGAAITASEWSNYTKQYFPAPGDTQETLAQKARSRELAISNLAQEGKRVPSQYNRESPAGASKNQSNPSKDPLGLFK